MYKKYEISGKILVKTGLHIGGSTQYAPIGSVNNPIVRDSLTNEPIIPGSSLKGKMRTLLARAKSPGNIVKQPEDDDAQIKALFGKASKGEDGKVITGRLSFSDMKVDKANREQLRTERFLESLTDVKFENNIARTTGVATPRQIERVVPGVEFDLSIIYDAWFSCAEKIESIKSTHEVLQKSSEDEEIICRNQIESDFKLIGEAMKLLELDYLGGHGSRGYGKIEFKNLEVHCVFGCDQDKDEKDLEKTLTKLLPNNVYNCRDKECKNEA